LRLFSWISLILFIGLVSSASSYDGPHNSVEFEYPLLVGAGLRYEHLLVDHLALTAGANAALEIYILFGSANVGLTYYFNNPFNGLYSSISGGYCAAIYPGMDENGASPVATLALGFKTMDRNFYVRPEVSAIFAPQLPESAIVPKVSIGFGGNFGGKSTGEPPKTSDRADSLEIGFDYSNEMEGRICLDYEKLLWQHLAFYLGPRGNQNNGGGQLGLTGYFFKPFNLLGLRLGGTYLRDYEETKDVTLLSSSLIYKAPLGSSWFFHIGLGGEYLLGGSYGLSPMDEDRRISYNFLLGGGMEF